MSISERHTELLGDLGLLKSKVHNLSIAIKVYENSDLTLGRIANLAETHYWLELTTKRLQHTKNELKTLLTYENVLWC